VHVYVSQRRSESVKGRDGMNYQNATQAYMRTAAKVGGQRLPYRRATSLDISGGLALLQKIGKTVL
jgi:hypothetical protein